MDQNARSKWNKRPSDELKRHKVRRQMDQKAIRQIKNATIAKGGWIKTLPKSKELRWNAINLKKKGPKWIERPLKVKKELQNISKKFDGSKSRHHQRSLVDQNAIIKEVKWTKMPQIDWNTTPLLTRAETLDKQGKIVLDHPYSNHVRKTIIPLTDRSKITLKA